VKVAPRSLVRSGAFLIMYYVYILQSLRFPDEVYIGFTTNVIDRLSYHNQGKVFHTNKYKPWELIYYSAFKSEQRAIDFEKYLKTGSGFAFRNKRLI
jgi:putative endonuclease